MEILTVDINSLSLDENNARTHNERNLEAIGGSLDEFGQVEPLVVQKTTGKVIGGNGRLEVLRQQGARTVEIVEIDLDDNRATALGLALNRTAELAEWDFATLEDLTNGLEDFDLGDIGFDSSELDVLLGSAEPENSPESLDEFPDDDAIPDAPTVTEWGDIASIGNHQLICGECIGEMSKLEDNTIDAICTDPPYGIGYMGSKWDCSVPGSDFAREAFRVLKPGGHIIAFAATRTVHRLAISLEDCGFEIRDLIGWLTWTGFPKSRNLGNGWGTALKPAHEPAILCRKPLDGNIAENILKWGTGGLNIDACRIPNGDPSWPGPQEDDSQNTRFPANIFACPKVSRTEREEGCEDLQGKSGAEAVKRKPNTAGLKNPRAGAGRTAAHVKNHHPTVKPQSLMRHLLRLITPIDGLVLEPFAGSGSTLIAAEREGFRTIGIEKEPDFCDIAIARLTAAHGNP